jgi:hypothetical protein
LKGNADFSGFAVVEAKHQEARLRNGRFAGQRPGWPTTLRELSGRNGMGARVSSWFYRACLRACLWVGGRLAHIILRYLMGMDEKAIRRNFWWTWMKLPYEGRELVLWLAEKMLEIEQGKEAVEELHRRCDAEFPYGELND